MCTYRRVIFCGGMEIFLFHNRLDFNLFRLSVKRCKMGPVILASPCLARYLRLFLEKRGRLRKVKAQQTRRG